MKASHLKNENNTLTIQQLVTREILINWLNSYLGKEYFLENVKEHDIRTFINSERRQGRVLGIQRLLSSCRTFEYLLNEGQIKLSPAQNISSPKLPQLLPKAMDADLVQRLLDFKPSGMIEVRDKA